MDANISESARRRLRFLGALALVATGALHLDLYLTGYREIKTIGPLFLVQATFAIGLGLSLLVQDRPLAAFAGAGFSLGTLAGYLLSRATGLFGFHEVSTLAGVVGEIVELLAFVLLAEVAISHRNTRTRCAASRFNGKGPLAQFVIAAIGIVMVALSVAGAQAVPRSAPSAATRTPSVNTQSITITNFAFVPERVTVSPGAEIVVINRDSVAHSVTAVTGQGNVRAFNSGNIDPGQRAIIRAPRTPGSYSYFCDIHNFMTGVIIVKP